MSAATPLELRLSKVVDEGAIFSIFSIVSAIEDFAIVAANYRYHEAVAAMGLIRAYPREWKGEALPCEFVYYAITFNDQRFYVVKFVNMLGLYAVDGNILGNCDAKETYLNYLGSISLLGISEDYILDCRHHDYLQTIENYSYTTAMIDKLAFFVLIGNFDGGCNVKTELVKCCNFITEDPEWTPQLKAQFHEVSITDWIENIKKGTLWALPVPTFDKLFVELP